MVNSVHSYLHNFGNMTELPNTPRILLEDYDASNSCPNDASKRENVTEYPDYLLTADGKYSSHFLETTQRSRGPRRNRIVSLKDLPSDNRRLHGRSNTIGSHTDLRVNPELSSGLEKIMLRKYSATVPDTDDSDDDLRAIDNRATSLHLPEGEEFFRSRACSNPSPLMRRRRLCPTKVAHGLCMKNTLECATGDNYTDRKEDFEVPIQRNISRVDVNTDEQSR